MSTNGHLSPSELSPIAGGGQLIHSAAASWNQLANHIYEQTGQKIAPKGPYSSYRTYAMQGPPKSSWCPEQCNP